MRYHINKEENYSIPSKEWKKAKCTDFARFWSFFGHIQKKVNLLHNPQKKSKQQISKSEASPSSWAGRKPRWGWTSDGAHGCSPLAAERRSLFAAVSCTALRSGVALCPRNIVGILTNQTKEQKKQRGTLTALRSGVALCPRTIVGILINREWFYGNTRMPTITKTNETFWYYLDG